MLIVALEPRRVEQLIQRESFSRVHLKARVQKLEQLVRDVRIGQRKLAADNVRLAPEGISSENGEVKRHADGPNGGRLGLIEPGQDPLGRHALQRALELAERLAAHPQIRCRAKVDDFDRVVLQVDDDVLGLDVAVHDALRENRQANANQLSENLF